ncbi:MAG: hypothetical protein ACLFQB_07085 [Chitinispirillaceae bacterium]
MGSLLKKLSFLLFPGVIAVAVAFSGITGCTSDEETEEADTVAVVDTADPVQRVTFSDDGDSLYLTDHKITTKIMTVEGGDYIVIDETDSTWTDTTEGGAVPADQPLTVNDTNTSVHFEVSDDGDSLTIYDTTIITETYQRIDGEFSLEESDTETVSDTVTGGKVSFVVIKDDFINEGDTVDLNASLTYHLSGFVFVEKGAVLNIPPGTVIKGEPGGGLNASALIIARGGKIYAEGTAEEPIIFTTTADDINYDDDITLSSRGMWGGVIILGCANTNRVQDDGSHWGQIEGINPDDPRGKYGADDEFDLDENDNSGVFKYVSIRYGGTNIGEGNEINGLTMGAVGDGTTIEHVEVFNNDDDGFEWFGGCVNTKHLVSCGNGDDSFDWDEGFKGKGQFWVVIQDPNEADRGIEADGSSKTNFGNDQVSQPTLANMTFVGSGSASSNMDNLAFKFREETKVKLYNSIITDFKGSMKFDDEGSLEACYVLDIDDGKGSDGNKVSDHLTAGESVIENNMFFAFGQITSSSDIVTDPTLLIDAETPVIELVTESNTFDVDPELTSITRHGGGTLDLRPASGSPALSGAEDISDEFFTATDYIGALDADDDWMDWTFTKRTY